MMWKMVTGIVFILRLETFILPSHADKNLLALESAEIFANHFALISQEYEPDRE